VVPKVGRKGSKKSEKKRDIYEFVESAAPNKIKELHEEVKRLTEDKNES
jgi:hypothetical protein